MAEPKLAELDAIGFLEALAERMEFVLHQQDDPKPLIAEILDDAENAGILGRSGPMRTRPDLFVMDLLLDNPLAFEWAQVAREFVDPRMIDDECDLLDAIWLPK